MKPIAKPLWHPTPDARTGLSARLRRRVLTAAFLFVLVSFTAPAVSFWDDMPDDELVEQLLAEMPDADIIAQVFMVGWVGQSPSPEIVSWIRERNIGGVKIFGWNGGDLVTLAESIGSMQALAATHDFSIPLLTATDQEGGWVRHIKGGNGLETSTTPGNMAIGASGLPYDAYRSAYYIGLELRALGVNMNFAPTVDVYVNPEAHVIGPRAFSDDPVASGLLGVAYYQGMEQARIISTAKHFPGHGNAAGDSHGYLPVIQDTYDVLWGRDLLPYRFLISEGLPAILSGHLNFPNITGDGRPASLSPYFGHTVLGDQLGFSGIVMTDDLYMGGAWQYAVDNGWGIGDLVVEAIRAGNDMVLLSRTPDLNGQIWDAVFSEYHSNPDFQERVRSAARTVLRIKLRYLKDEDRVPLQPDSGLLPRLMRTQDGAEYFRDQAGRSVTRVRSEDLPYPPTEDERVLLAGKDGDFLRIGTEFYPGADRFRISSATFEYASSADLNRFRQVAGDYDTVIFCLSDPNSLEVLQQAADLDVRVIVFSILTPVYLLQTPWVHTAIAVYGWGDESFRAGFSVLTGQMEAEGTLPIRMDHPAAIPTGQR